MRQNIPAELRQLPQWVVAGPDKIPLNPRTGKAASVTDPGTWATFEEANRSAYPHVGFVLSDNDPYTIIDLDNKEDKPCSQEQWARHQKILELFASYTERSASGRGYHIIVRGRIPAGVHRDNVEVYCSGRYMICTGNVVRNIPITDFQPLLDQLFHEMKPADRAELVDRDELLCDRDLVEMAMDAVNGEKFDDLCNGLWQEMGYPSQSEADFALIQWFCYYSRSNAQVRRLFRYSMLGRREKAVKNDQHIDRVISKIRAKEAPPVDIDALAAQFASLSVPPPQTPAPVQQVMARPQDVTEPPPTVELSGVELPPGLVGEMAMYFYQTAVRPVPEIALSAALALMAGVAGRSYNISGTGLNLYLMLIAKTGAGKEGAVTGMDNLIAAVRPQIPMVDQFVGPGAFASGQALIKVLDERPCFVSVLGEFGLTLQQICDPNASSAQIMLRKVLLDLYSKSGWTKILRSSVYSDVEKNTKIVQAPNVTLLGESTPEAFFESLDSSHIAEGLIPRFCFIEYNGDRPPRNPNAGMPPTLNLVQRFADAVTIALTTSNNGTCVAVQVDQPAQIVLDDFDRESDAAINVAKADVELQLWNRAHLKALKLAALLSVGVNPHQPVVTRELAEWAIRFVRRDVSSVATRYKSGDVGHGDAKLGFDLRRILKAYVDGLNYKQVEPYGVTPSMHKDKVVPYIYLNRRTANLSAFKRDRRGASNALRAAIQDLVESHVLIELSVGQLNQRYQFGGKAWMVKPGSL